MKNIINILATAIMLMVFNNAHAYTVTQNYAPKNYGVSPAVWHNSYTTSGTTQSTPDESCKVRNSGYVASTTFTSGKGYKCSSSDWYASQVPIPSCTNGGSLTASTISNFTCTCAPSQYDTGSSCVTPNTTNCSAAGKVYNAITNQCENPPTPPNNCPTSTQKIQFPNTFNGASYVPKTTVCMSSCQYKRNVGPTAIDDCYSFKNDSAKTIYCSWNYKGTGQTCSDPNQVDKPSPKDNGNPTPPPLKCPEGMHANATNNGCISDDDPNPCQENFIKNPTTGVCEPMACPVCTIWLNSANACVQDTACAAPIPKADTDNDGTPDPWDDDMDGDGSPNANDNDVDGDGVANNKDSDIDGDGVPNGQDSDMDGDGEANSVDSDINGDNEPNASDDDPKSEGTGQGDCSDEPEKCNLLTDIKDRLTVSDEAKTASQKFVDGEAFTDELLANEESYLDLLDSKVQETIDDSTLLTAYQDLLPESPWSKLNVQTTCEFNTTLRGRNYTLSLCQAQQYLHPILLFAGFILTATAIFGLLINKEH